MNGPDTATRKSPVMIVVLAGAAIYPLGLIVSLGFFRGAFPGPYWLYIGWMRIAPWMALGLPVVGLIVLIAGIVQMIRKRPKDVLGAGIGLLLAGLFVLAYTSIPRTLWRHWDSVQMGGRTYHLAAYTTWVESHFAIFECRTPGICRNVYLHAPDEGPFRSGDRVYFEQEDGRLRVYYQFQSREEPRLLYTYQPLIESGVPWESHQAANSRWK